MIRLLFLLFISFSFAQTKVKQYVVNCEQNTVIRENMIIGILVFESNILPMSYDSELIIYEVIGGGKIVSPSDFDTYPKNNEQEPKVIVMGCRRDYPTLKISKHINVIYKCND